MMDRTPQATPNERANRDMQAILDIQNLWSDRLDQIKLRSHRELLRRADFIVGKRVPTNVEALEIVLRGMVAESRQSRRNVDLHAPDYISAYGEAIGIPDERFPENPHRKAGASDTDLCLLRAGLQIGKDKGSGCLTSVRRVRERLVSVRWDILAAFDSFIARPEAVDRAIREFYGQIDQEVGTSVKDSPVSNALDQGGSLIGAAGSSITLPGYVHREREEAEFRRFIAEGAKLIAFVGQAGMGKTMLAKAITGDAPRLRVKGGSIIRDDLEAVFVANGIDRKSTSLAELVCGDRALPYVIIDNLESADELRETLPAIGTRSIIVATCRRKGNAPPSDCRFITTRKMSLDEAIELVALNLKDVANVAAHGLAATLDCHPLSLHYACQLISQGGISLQTLCLQVAKEAQDLQPYTEDGSAFQAVQRRTLYHLAAHSQVAYAMFEALHIFGDSNARFLQAVACATLDRHVSTLESVEAVDTLHRFSLIDESASTPSGKSFIRLELRHYDRYSKLDACLYMTQICRYLILHQADLQGDANDILFAAGYYAHLYFISPGEASNYDAETWDFMDRFHLDTPKAMRDGFMTAHCRMNVDPADDYLGSTSDKGWY